MHRKRGASFRCREGREFSRVIEVDETFSRSKKEAGNRAGVAPRKERTGRQGNSFQEVPTLPAPLRPARACLIIVGSRR